MEGCCSLYPPRPPRSSDKSFLPRYPCDLRVNTFLEKEDRAWSSGRSSLRPGHNHTRLQAVVPYVALGSSATTFNTSSFSMPSYVCWRLANLWGGGSKQGMMKHFLTIALNASLSLPATSEVSLHSTAALHSPHSAGRTSDLTQMVTTSFLCLSSLSSRFLLISPVGALLCLFFFSSSFSFFLLLVACSLSSLT